MQCFYSPCTLLSSVSSAPFPHSSSLSSSAHMHLSFLHSLLHPLTRWSFILELLSNSGARDAQFDNSSWTRIVMDHKALPGLLQPWLSSWPPPPLSRHLPIFCNIWSNFSLSSLQPTLPILPTFFFITSFLFSSLFPILPPSTHF